MAVAIKSISIEGYKSFSTINDFKFNDLNIIIGANGCGKSNFIEIFRMLGALKNKSFTRFIMEHGGASDFLHNGPKETETIRIEFTFTDDNVYRLSLLPTINDRFLISEDIKYSGTSSFSSIGVLTDESSLTIKDSFFNLISNSAVYHFHDTGNTSLMRRAELVDDNKKLRENASNIAPFLLHLRYNYKNNYDEIIAAIRLVMPFFDDFILDEINYGEAVKVKLNWMQKGSDYPMQPYHFSDGSIRFIALTTALLQPNPPSIIIIDEPELGLHPVAIETLSELIEAASKKVQIIIATQSPLLIDQFNVEDIIVMARNSGASIFKRLSYQDFQSWLEDYSLGELWMKNIIQGGPSHE